MVARFSKGDNLVVDPRNAPPASDFETVIAYHQGQSSSMRIPFLSKPAPDQPHAHVIRLRLREISQLFNSMDPSPFIEKDLDDHAEEFIVGWAQELSHDAPLRLSVYLDQWPAEDPREMIQTAVHHYFAHRAQITNMEFKRLLEQGRTSLLIGVVFLSACLALSNLFLSGDAGTFAAVGRESLTIGGWVAMWRPMQIYLYDWWPLRRRIRVFQELSRMPVELVPREKK